MPTLNSSLPNPKDIFRAELSNGIVFLARANFNAPSVSMGGYLPAGSISEADEKLGLADFVAASLMRGTAFHNFDSIYNELESVGASLGFDSGSLNTHFGGRALTEDLPLLLRLLAESLQAPTFPRAEVERLRAQLLTGLSLREQDTSDMAALHFDRMLYQDHPYARPEDGFVETIQSITRKDLQDFHRRYYGPRGMVIAVVGAMEPRKAFDLAEKYLGGWSVPRQNTAAQIPPIKPLAKTLRHHHVIADKSQSDIVIGMFAPRRADEDFFPASLGNSILGRFGMMGRIGASVREKAGLAYSASSSLHAGVTVGSWEVDAGVNPKNLDKAIDLILKELKKFAARGVTKDELAENQANYIGRLPLSLESNGGVASALLNLERYQLGLDYYPRYESFIRAVTREQILEVARKYIDVDKLVISTAGPSQ
ncbi:MAG: pitrilysin family protein [Anaerolineales bacterium]